MEVVLRDSFSDVAHHIHANEILAPEHKKVYPGSRGTNDQLMIDNMVGVDCKS